MTDVRKCLVSDCEREHYGKGYCQKHYQRWRSHGDPEIVHEPAAMPSSCEQCGRTLRSRKTRSADAPGTIEYAARGLCRTCYQNPSREFIDPGLKEEIEFMLSVGENKDSLHRNPGIAKMAVEFVLKKMGYV